MASPPPLMPPMLTTCKTLPTEEKPSPSQQQKQKSKQSRNLPISVTIVILWQDGKNQNQFATATSKSDRRSISHNLLGNVSVVLPLEDRLSSFNHNRKTIIKAHMVKPNDELVSREKEEVKRLKKKLMMISNQVLVVDTPHKVKRRVVMYVTFVIKA